MSLICFVDVVEGFLSTWQLVQLDMRSRTGDYQRHTSNETSCKDRCLQNPDCIGINWHNSLSMCFLVYDCNTSLQADIGYAHWEIRRYKSIPITCQGRLAKLVELNEP